MNEEKRSNQVMLYLGFGIAIVSLFFGGNDFSFDFVLLTSIVVLVAGISGIRSESVELVKEIQRFQIFLISISLFVLAFRNLVPNARYLISIPRFSSPGAVSGNTPPFINSRILKVNSIIQVVISLIGITGLGISLWGVARTKCKTK